MSEWIDVIETEQLQPGVPVVREIDGVPVAVVELEGSYYAFEDLCTHEGAPMAEDGDVEGDQVVCPWHGARFCMKTGRALTAPAYEDLRCFETRVVNGRVQVRGI